MRSTGFQCYLHQNGGCFEVKKKHFESCYLPPLRLIWSINLSEVIPVLKCYNYCKSHLLMLSKRSVDINQFFVIKGQIHDVAHACMSMMNCVTLYYLKNVTCPIILSFSPHVFSWRWLMWISWIHHFKDCIVLTLILPDNLYSATCTPYLQHNYL